MTSFDSAGVQFVQEVPIVQTPSLNSIRGWGLERFKQLERFEPSLLRVVVLALTMKNPG
jgi:hypothetical protein